MQRIAFISVHASPLASLGGKKTGGMNVYVRELAREIGSRGIPVDIFTRRIDSLAPEIDYSLGENVRVIHITAGIPAPLDPEAIYPHLQQFAAGVITFATRERLTYDIVYSHYWLSGWVAHKLNEAWNTPFVQMFHTLGQMKNRITAAPLPIADARTTTETQIMHWATRLIAATPAEQQQLMWLYRADRRKITVIPPGVNSERFRPLSPATAKTKLAIPLDSKLLLFVGRIEPLKGIDTILQALHHLRIATPQVLEQVIFGIVGGAPDNPDDPELARLKVLSNELNLSDMVRFFGAKEQTLLPVYYAAATALIMSSDYESFGMVALEAMASGTPVIASEVGGLAFLVRDGETGFLVPVREPQALADRINRLLTNSALRTAMGHRAAQLAQHYTWASIADQVLAVFDEVLTRRKPVTRHTS